MGFFKAYDMRGTFGVDFDLDVVYRVGKALPLVVSGGRWLVGRDCRTTSAAIRDALVAGLTKAGVEVVDLGLTTTPMVYFHTAEGGFDGSVMVTASHNPPSDNGLKVSKRGALPVGYADGLDRVERIVAVDSERYEPVGNSVPSVTDRPRLERYLDFMRSRISFAGLRIGIDASNGMSSLLARELFPDAVIINDTLDGSFPCHSPNPLKAEAREQLASLVRKEGLDCGLIFDGDADRAMFVDERGEFVQPDYLIPIIARATLKASASLQAPPKVVHDVRTSRGVIETLTEMGMKPVMVPVGHAFAKPVIRREQAVCGGELAGHYYFGEFFGCDSGVLAAIRVLNELAEAKRSGMTFSGMMSPIVSRYANSGELNFRVEDKDAAIARVLDACRSKFPPELSRSEIDGIRIEYAEGWINIRKSNTEPYLRLIVEAKTAALLGEWTALLSEAIDAR